MAFDIYFGKESTFIDHHEELLFELVNDDPLYPNLNWLWEHFYNGPLITAERANDLVHELISIREKIKDSENEKYLLVPIDRVMPILSKAFKNNQQLQCVSD